ncbi:L10-interacting MYB domain-containing protein [Bienertia sinuspersici]
MKASTSLRWTVHMDKVFLNALIAEEINGNCVDGLFTSKAYENVVKECTEKLGHPFTKENLKNRLKAIKSNFSEVYYMFNASRWGWNEEMEMFENDNKVWKDLIELFSKDREPGELAATAKERKLNAMGESSVDIKEESDGELPRPKGLDNVAQALCEGNLIVERGRAQVYSPQEVLDELTRMEFDLFNRHKAYRFFTAKQLRIHELFECPSKERKAYLIEMMFEEDI